MDNTAISGEKWASDEKIHFISTPTLYTLTLIIFHLQCRDIRLLGAIKGIFICDYLIIN